MGVLRKAPAVKAEVVSDPTVMSGDPVVKGTRTLAETILGYLRAGHSSQAIYQDYPSLPVDGIDAVARWAEQAYGAPLEAGRAKERVWARQSLHEQGADRLIG